MATIFCKTESFNQIGFYLQSKGKTYFLCYQRFYKSVWDYFAGGVKLNSLFSRAGKHSHAIRAVKLKLPAYIEYVEREEGVRVLDKTIAKGNGQIGAKKRRESKVCSYDWRSDEQAKIA
jgi:hypothetical protein